MEYKEICLGNEKYFLVDNGERVRRQDVQKAKGKIPVYSSSKYKDEKFGFVSDKIKDIVPNAKKFNGLCITINADATDYAAFLRNETFYANDVLNIIKTVSEEIYLPFIVYELNNVIKKMDLAWNNKLYKGKLKTIQLNIPVDENGNFDLGKQKEIANKYQKIEDIKERLKKDYEKFINIKVGIKKHETVEIPINQILIPKKGNSKYTKAYIHNNSGKFPVYSSQTTDLGIIGSINTYDYDLNCFTWTTDGTYVGTVFLRDGKFSITTHCGLLRLKSEYNSKIDMIYLYYILNITLPKFKLGEGSNKRLGTERMKDVLIDIPVDENGNFDLGKQKEIANKYQKIDDIKERLKKDYDRIDKINVELL